MLQCSVLHVLRSYPRSLVARRINDIEKHGHEKIENENGQGAIHHGFGCGPPDTDRSFTRGKAFVATDKDDENRETNCLAETHDNVA